ncbi:VCBS repeat-containing protein [Arenibacter sp. F26102]|uniref:VCBS repeat-containing protein n=1 Tax=Arenibacter sp. F26102 TaxID=2926416 RepID=UPI001FF6A500|nr:VCBS repeat-containing protein [Arenibacter sp. F26102]MCK0144554.1 VCBS repeat-containing protein [Arenibacter sp. F26102]
MILCIPFIGCEKSKNTLFYEMAPDYTGIDFKNVIIQNDSLNILQFEYMYNGAGVAIADFDLDGLQDIYFTGNMTSNRLYRNLGHFKFEDVTLSANVGSTGWSNGVAIVDINQDGYADIYVAKGGPRSATIKETSNLLFINNGLKEGRLSFTEEAEKWGLADTNYSVQAAFLDYDSDGDLDMYLLNNALVHYNRNTARAKDRSGTAPSMDKLYRNNGDNTFTEVSESSGIVFEGFGLGLQICDLNTDGWPDIYVSNDFLTEDLLYINQKDGTFKNQIGDYMQHLTFNGMGNDIADINNDGLMDVMVLDMLPPDSKRWKLTMVGNNFDQFHNSLSHGYLPQYIRNTLQLNNGNGTFSEIGQISGISATEWSWSPLLADFDQDGNKDIFISNGYRQDITNLDFMVYGNQELTMGTAEANRKKRIEKLNALPGIKMHNFMYRNNGNLEFKDISEEAGFSKPTYSNGAAYADLDNDGDLDLVINNIDDPAGLYKNQMENTNSNNYIKFQFEGQVPNRQGLGSEVEVYYQGHLQKQYFTPYRGYLSTMEQALHFGLGKAAKIDSIKVTWPDGKIQKIQNLKANQVVTLKYTDAHISDSEYQRSESHQLLGKVNDLGLNFIHKEDDFVDFKVQPLLPHMHSRNGPGLAVSDVNGDGLEDIFIGGALGQSASIMLQKPDGQFVPSLLDNANYEDMGALFFDADNDGDQDLYVVSGGSSKPAGDANYRDQLYQNDGKGNFTSVPGLPESYVSGSVVTAADYDKDGDFDLFVGGRVKPGEYPLPTPSLLLKNTSTPNNIKFVKDRQAVNNIFEGLGMVTSAVWTDFNNDTWQDLIVIGEFMPIRIFKNNQGILSEITEYTGLENTHGWWNSINLGDFDNDGDTDYILGNLGLNSRYNASAKEPLCIYAKDYDKNGQIDPVMCYYINGKNYVAHSRKDLIDQINAMRGRFRTYSDYANATFDESFTKEEIKNALVVKSETFANAYLENLGSGQFKLTQLPRSSQIAPIYGTLVYDYNGDNNLDVLAVGNFYSGEVFSGRYDASIGWLLIGDGKGNFRSENASETGFSVLGDAKGMARLATDNSEMSVIGINDGQIQTFAQTTKSILYRLKANEVSAEVKFKGGRRQKLEFPYGSGYLSQSSRTLRIPKEAVSVKITDLTGNQKEILSMP